MNDWAGTVTAAWDFGILRLTGLFERIEYDVPSNNVGGGGTLKRNLWGIGANGPAGPGTWQIM